MCHFTERCQIHGIVECPNYSVENFPILRLKGFLYCIIGVVLGDICRTLLVLFLVFLGDLCDFLG